MKDAQCQARIAELETAIREAREAAAAAERAKAAFLANMSHEIRTPLNAILGFNAMLHGSDLSLQQREWLGYIDSNGRHLLDLLDEVLDLAKIETGSMQLSAAAFNLPSLVDEVFAHLLPKARAQGLQLTGTVAAELPGEWVGDAHRLRQVLINVVGNAVKFTEHGSVTLEVSHPEGDSGRLAFAVSDTGIGISSEVQQRLFTRFMQADESFTRKHGGIGLGLRISKALVELMGGGLTVESRSGEGTTVRFSVKFERGHDAVQGMLLSEAVAGGAVSARCRHRPRFGRLRALVVEGDANSRRTLEEQLHQLGLTPDIALDGRTALDRVQARAYDVIFMDVEMPGMNGLETTRWLRAAVDYATAPDVPIVALTSPTPAVDHARCLAAGMTDCLSKPTSLGSIEEALGRMLQKRPC